MLRYAKARCVDLILRQHIIAIFDVFVAHISDEIFDLLQAKNINPVFVPANSTVELQLLDAQASPNLNFN